MQAAGSLSVTASGVKNHRARDASLLSSGTQSISATAAPRYRRRRRRSRSSTLGHRRIRINLYLHTPGIVMIMGRRAAQPAQCIARTSETERERERHITFCVSRVLYNAMPLYYAHTDCALLCVYTYIQACVQMRTCVCSSFLLSTYRPQRPAARERARERIYRANTHSELRGETMPRARAHGSDSRRIYI